MKKILLFSFLASMLLLAGCNNKDEGVNYPDSNEPVITTSSDLLYSNPNRNFVIEALLSDDLGLASVQIEVPALFLNKTIVFAKDSLLTSYKLEYKFLAPANTQHSDTYKVTLTLVDVSGRTTRKELTLMLDGDFNAPRLENMKPVQGAAIFKKDETSVDVSFTIVDVSGIDYVVVKLDALSIYDSVALNGAKSYDYSKNIVLPGELVEYEVQVVAKDNFAYPNTSTTKLKFAVVASLPSMYLVDVPKGTDLSTDIFGVPMYFHEKAESGFTFKYYADTDNKEVYLLGQESSFAPHCFGLDASGNMMNSSDCLPIVLPAKGYYKIVINPSEMTYSAEKYTPTSVALDPQKTQLVFAGGGAVDAGWNPSNTAFIFTQHTDNPYLFSIDLELDGGDFESTITPYHAEGWWIEPFFRIGENGVAPTNEGSNAKYKGNTGTYTLWLDTELERVKLVSKK